MLNKFNDRLNEFVKSKVSEGSEGKFDLYFTSVELNMMKSIKQRNLLISGVLVSLKVNLKRKCVTVNIVNPKEFYLKATDSILRDFVSSSDDAIKLEDFIAPLWIEFDNLLCFKDILINQSIYNMFFRGIIVKGTTVSAIKDNDEVYIVKVAHAKHSGCIFNFRNRPYIEISSLASDFVYVIPQELDVYKDMSNGEMSICLKLKDLKVFMDANNIKEYEIKISEKSINCFYAYSENDIEFDKIIDNLSDMTYFVNFTDAIVNKWWNSNNPSLYKLYVNHNGEGETVENISMLHVATLIERVYINDTKRNIVNKYLAIEEVDAIFKSRKDTQLYDQVRISLNLNKFVEIS